MGLEMAISKLINKLEMKLEKMINENPQMAKEVLEKQDQNKYLVKRFLKKTHIKKGR